MFNHLSFYPKLSYVSYNEMMKSWIISKEYHNMASHPQCNRCKICNRYPFTFFLNIYIKSLTRTQFKPALVKRRNDDRHIFRRCCKVGTSLAIVIWTKDLKVELWMAPRVKERIIGASVTICSSEGYISFLPLDFLWHTHSHKLIN